MAKKLPPPAPRTEKKLLTKDVVKAFGSHRQLCDALGLTIQAVHHWPKYVPKGRVYELLELKPELKAKVIEQAIKYKVVERVVQRYVRA